MWKLNKHAECKKLGVHKRNHYSIRNKLRREGRSEENFETMLNNLDLEEIIALKLELATRATGGSRLYGLPLWTFMPILTKNALIKFAISACRSKAEAAALLGLTARQLHNLMEQHKVKSFFEEGERDGRKKACVSFGHERLSE